MEKVERKPANPVPMRSITELFSYPTSAASSMPELHPLSETADPKKRRRRLSDEILVSIFKSLRETGGFETIGSLAKSAKISRNRMVSYLELIE